MPSQGKVKHQTLGGTCLGFGVAETEKKYRNTADRLLDRCIRNNGIKRMISIALKKKTSSAEDFHVEEISRKA